MANSDDVFGCLAPIEGSYALGAFLAGYRGLTRDAYALDLRQFLAWCCARA